MSETQKSILDLDLEELKSLMEGTLDFVPSIDGLETHPKFDKIFFYRSDIKKLAKFFYQDRLKGAIRTDPLKAKRLELQKEQIELKREKLLTQTYFQQLIFDNLNSIEQTLLQLKATLQRIETKLDATQGIEDSSDE